MGYTHYWYRKISIPSNKMQPIANDFGKVVLALDDMGVHLADGFGKNAPEISAETIWFNGLENCGHRKNEEVSIPWPDRKANGVNSRIEPISGQWFAGSLLSTRTCNGDCSYETFHFPAEMDKSGYLQTDDKRKDLYFNCCKTAFRPYDLAVTAFLIIAKHHLGEDIIVNSDGEDEHWIDAKRLCQAFLGYGEQFRMADTLICTSHPLYEMGQSA